MPGYLERIEGFHVAIIMDGNGRWARRRCLPRPAGHRAGVDTVRRIVPACPNLGIRVLTLYAFSSDNWNRPKKEVRALMDLMRRYLAEEIAECVAKKIRVNILGRRDRLPPDLCRAIEEAERATTHLSDHFLRIAVDYSARDAILQAAREGEIRDRAHFAERLQVVHHANAFAPPVDLLVRTGGEQRLSDFLLWESAYAELYFCPKFWPDFQEGDLAAAVREFHCRQRRFGRIPSGNEIPA